MSDGLTRPLVAPEDLRYGSAALKSRAKATADHRAAVLRDRAQWIIDRYLDGYPRGEIAHALGFPSINLMFLALEGRDLPAAMRPEPDPKQRAQALGLTLGNLNVALRANLATGGEIRLMADLIDESDHQTLADMLVATFLAQLRAL